MSFALNLAAVKMEDATELLTDDLDRIIGRLTRPDAHLVLEQESAQWWIVVDQANPVPGLDEGTVMMRADRELCVRFMRAFAERHPEATVDLPDAEYSWRVAQALGVSDTTNVPHNVFRIRPHEPLDEVGA